MAATDTVREPFAICAERREVAQNDGADGIYAQSADALSLQAG